MDLQIRGKYNRFGAYFKCSYLCAHRYENKNKKTGQGKYHYPRLQQEHGRQ